MVINMQKALEELISISSVNPKMQLPDITLDTEKITAIMINEVVPIDPNNNFYGKNSPPEYLTTTLQLFQKAGIQVNTIDEVLACGVYITNAVKIPKTGYAIEKSVIEECVPLLAKEIDLFPRLRVIMLMGDVAKKAFNIITRQRTGKNAVPAISTYKLRNSEIFYGGIRVFPSYIMTGGNILIEKSKFEMAAEDIKKMMEIIGQFQ